MAKIVGNEQLWFYTFVVQFWIRKSGHQLKNKEKGNSLLAVQAAPTPKYCEPIEAIRIGLH